MFYLSPHHHLTSLIHHHQFVYFIYPQRKETRQGIYSREKNTGVWCVYEVVVTSSHVLPPSKNENTYHNTATHLSELRRSS